MPDYPLIHENGVAYLTVRIVRFYGTDNREPLAIEPMAVIEKDGKLSLKRGFCKDGLNLLPESSYQKFMAWRNSHLPAIPEWEFIEPNKLTGIVTLEHAVEMAISFAKRKSQALGKPGITAEIRPENLPQYVLATPPPKYFHGKVYLVARTQELADVINHPDPQIADIANSF